MDDIVIPRGIRACNPGNVRISNIPWEGKVTPSIDSEFETFSSMEMGVRCAAKIFINYSKLDGLSTIAQYIDRWAPPSDSNPTNDYAEFVATACSVDPNNTFNVLDSGNLSNLLTAVFRFEQGVDYCTPEQIASGVEQALSIT